MISRITGELPEPGPAGPSWASASADGDAQPPADAAARTPGSRTPYPSFGDSSGPDPAAEAPTQQEKPPLPVRRPRRRNASGAADAGRFERSPSDSGFDYFAAARRKPEAPSGPPPAAVQEPWERAEPFPSRPTAEFPGELTEASTGAPQPQWPSIPPDDTKASSSWDPWRRPSPERSEPAGRLFEPAGTTDRFMTSGGPDDMDTFVGGSRSLPAWVSATAQEPATGTDPHRTRREPREADAEWDAPAPEPEPVERPKRKRDPYLDNVKFIGIALVPLGHSLVPTLAADSSRALYLYIYVFHMPLFVIISGYLSRNFWNSNAKTNKLVDTFLVPYVIVEIGYALLRTAFGHKWSLTITDPAWLNWYLIALLFWRLSTPVWKRMRYPVTIAIIVYLFAGFSDLSGDFSMDRFFGLMPFFVIGLMLKPGVFDFLQRRWVRVLSVLVLVGAAAVAIFLVKNFSIKLGPIYYKNSYHDLHLVWWKGMALRIALLIAALAMSGAVMSLVPRRETWFTDLGTRTLYCYLLHGVPVMIAKEMGWLSFPWLYGPLGVAAIASSTFALAIVLCLPITRRLFKWLLEPRLVWLYRKPSGQRS